MLSGLGLAAILAIWLLRRGRSLAPRWRIAGWAAATATFAIVVAIAPPVVVLRKLVGVALMPTTLIWLALVALVVRAWPEPRWRWPLVGVLAAYILAGSPLTSYLLLRSLERPFRDLRPLADATRYDAVFVMGGGTAERPDGNPQLAASGDRVRMAAALHDLGRAPILVTSGSTLDGRRDVSAETTALWVETGIPRTAVVLLPGPRNSAGEIVAYARLARDRGWRRVGLVTSARHLPRALALCRRHGLEVDPLPADFRAEPPPRDPLALIPTGEGFADVQSSIWEYVGLAAVHLIGG